MSKLLLAVSISQNLVMEKYNLVRGLTTPLAYGKLQAAWSRGVVAKHAALSRPRSRVRIPSGPLLR